MKKNKIISLILTIVILTTAILPILQTTVNAESYVIDYRGSVTYGGSKVGKFFIEGKRGFCMDHAKATPNSGTVVTEEIYHDNNVLKCLYYGLDGEKAWNFKSEEQGIVYTTLALDHFVHGNRNIVAQEFIDYVNSMPVPEIILDFSEKNLNSYIEANNMQRTQSITISGDSQYYLTLPLQEGVTLVNETKGTREVGNANIYGGDRFYLTAPLNINGTWSTNNIQNNKYIYNPIVYKTNSETYQVIASGYRAVKNGNTQTSLTVNWISVGALEIYKKDRETGEKISNTKFELRDEKGVIVDTITTNSEGYAKSENLIAGKYTLKEISTDNKYILDDTPIEVTIMPGETKTIDITNKRKEGNLKIAKVDSRDKKTPISNVTFEIWRVETKEKVATKTTGEDGTIIINNLITGTYKIKEISTNEWYILNPEENTVEIQWGQTAEVKIENDIKTENVKFEIRNSKGILVDTLVTNKEGYAKSKQLPLDEKYEVKETQTTSKYIISSQIENVKFTPKDDKKQLKFTNKHKQGNIKVVKIDANNNKITLGGVEFELYSEEFKKVIGKYTTNSDGEITIENLRIGNYKLKETLTNKWYNLAQDTEIVVEENKTNEVIIKNELKKGQVKVVKVDKENNEIRIPNVVFEVQDDKGNVLEEIVTNENGEAQTKKYPIRDYQILQLHEIQTNELYNLNDEIVKVELSNNTITEIIIENEKIQGQIKIIKTSSEDNYISGEKAGSPIQNVKFEIYDYNNELVDTIVTDETGVAITKLLYKGEYIIKEVETAEEYILNDKEFLVQINKHNEIVEIEITNEPKKPEEKKLPRTGF